ncbi:unnamed protein product [Paramecium primaurelia]|uniref:Uncharacterized protein n=1 Tax=Paramecium primaurelia TaxID=5886 RepID=A0A8S1KD05_PARPR|nr:unnamed protein product [Paramecium primaurelia]
MTDNKPLNQKIKIINIKRSHQNNSSAANPHNTYLDEKEVEYLKNYSNNLNVSNDINVWENILEWYLRTLGDELYKLAFINKEKYYRIKVFWSQDYEAFLNNQTAMQCENDQQNKGKQLDNVRYYLKQFENFEIEDYFDVIIFPKIEKTTNKLILKFLVNPFTYLLPSNTEQKLKSDKSYSQIEGLELFIDYEIHDFEQKNINILSELTNYILQKYVLRQEIKREDIKITNDQLRQRIGPIINEETRVVLYELYQDL